MDIVVGFMQYLLPWAAVTTSRPWVSEKKRPLGRGPGEEGGVIAELYHQPRIMNAGSSVHSELFTDGDGHGRVFECEER